MNIYQIDIPEAVGITGAITYLLSYFLLQLGLVKGEGFWYAFLNMLAASFVLYSLTSQYNTGSLIIQVSFISLSIYGIVKGFFLRREIRLSKNNKLLIEALMPELPKRRAMHLIQKGEIRNGKKTILAHEGKPLTHFSVLIAGSAKVKRGKRQVGKILPGQCIGDISYTQRGDATATVTLDGDGQYFCISVGKLREFLDKNEDIKSSFDRGISQQLIAKLI